MLISVFCLFPPWFLWLGGYQFYLSFQRTRFWFHWFFFSISFLLWFLLVPFLSCLLWISFALLILVFKMEAEALDWEFPSFLVFPPKFCLSDGPQILTLWFLSLRFSVLCCLCPVSYKPFFHVFCPFFGCFRWEGKSDPWYSIWSEVEVDVFFCILIFKNYIWKDLFISVLIDVVLSASLAAQYANTNRALLLLLVFQLRARHCLEHLAYGNHL